jgi:hypothetical protein
MQERIFKISRFIFGAGVLLSALAVPGYSSSSSFSFTGSSSGAIGLSGSGSGADVTCLGTGCGAGDHAIIFTILNPGGAALTVALSEATNSGIITLTATENGSGTYSNITNTENLVTITLLNATTALQNVASTIDIPWQASELGSISVNSALLSDLGWTNGANASFASVATTSLADNNQTANSGINNIGSGASNDITVNLTPIPEPMSFVLFGSGLLGVGWLARKSSSQRAR